MTRLSRIAGVVALLGTVVSACGARTGLDVPSLPAGSQFGNEAGSDAGADASTCPETNVAVEPNVPNLYFVLDISKSMLNDNKWDNIRPAIAGLIRQLGPNARFGAALFPNPNAAGTDNCATGAEVMSLRLGDSQGATANAFLGVTMVTPNGGTPTAATFRTLRQTLRPTLSQFRGPTFAILATDGGPNCNMAISTCPIAQCTLDIDNASPPMCAPASTTNCCDPTQTQYALALSGCLDGDATAQAIGDLRADGILTYVMGIPGSSPYGPVLDQMAIAGGTARAGQPRYYAVSSPDEAALAAGFQAIAEAAMKSCVLTLHDRVTNPDKVNVYVNGVVVPNGPEGWSLMGQTLTLEGTTCGNFGLGPADAAPAPIRVTQGCPTAR